MSHSGWFLRWQRHPDHSPVEVPVTEPNAEARAKLTYDLLVEDLQREYPLGWVELRIDGTVAYRFDARKQGVAHV